VVEAGPGTGMFARKVLELMGKLACTLEATHQVKMANFHSM